MRRNPLNGALQNIPLSYESAYQRSYDHAMENCLEARGNALLLMHDGESCPFCGARMKQIFDPGFPPVGIKPFHYWMPNCDCFAVCFRCGEVMIEEKFEEIDWCRNCGLGERDQKSKPRRKHVTDGKASASGPD